MRFLVACLSRNSCKSRERYCLFISDIKRVSGREICWSYWSKYFVYFEIKISRRVGSFKVVGCIWTLRTCVWTCTPQIVTCIYRVHSREINCLTCVYIYHRTISLEPVLQIINIPITVPCLTFRIKICNIMFAIIRWQR